MIGSRSRVVLRWFFKPRRSREIVALDAKNWRRIVFAWSCNGSPRSYYISLITETKLISARQSKPIHTPDGSNTNLIAERTAICFLSGLFYILRVTLVGVEIRWVIQEDCKVGKYLLCEYYWGIFLISCREMKIQQITTAVFLLYFIIKKILNWRILIYLNQC